MAVLVDTSVWINHFRNIEPSLVNLLQANKVLGHSFVRGELALGNLPQRQNILSLLDNLPQAPVAFTDEINPFIETHALLGLGIGFVDVHSRVWERAKRFGRGDMLCPAELQTQARLGLFQVHSHLFSNNEIIFFNPAISSFFIAISLLFNSLINSCLSLDVQVFKFLTTCFLEKSSRNWAL